MLPSLLFAVVLLQDDASPDPSSAGNRSAPAQEFISQKARFLRDASRVRRSRNSFLGEAQVRELRRSAAQKNLRPDRKAQLLGQLCRELLRVGEVESARRRLNQVLELARQNNLAKLSASILRLQADVALREAEVRNCITRHNCDCCILPLKGGGIHAEDGPARAAAAAFEALLEAQPNNLSLRWLFNLCKMATGEWPEEVDERLLIPESAFKSEVEVQRFVDVAASVGVDDFNLCGGSVVTDVDGDGLLDLVSSSSDWSSPLTYHANLGDGTFEDRAADSQLDDQLGGLNCIAADYDGDGDRDLFVLRGAWMGSHGLVQNSLLRNDEGHFVDVTRAAGVAEPAYPTQAACFGDFDGDGHLDLYVGNEAPSVQVAKNYPSQLFLNNGDGTFRDVAAEAGVENRRFCKGVAAGDYDNDGDLDLYTSNIGANRLYRNEGDGTFTDVAEQLGLTQPSPRSFATWFFDYDNDGWLDLFVTAYMCTLSHIAADHLDLPHQGLSPRLYHNKGDGTFEEVAKQTGLGHPWLPMGANFGDVDGDGWLDVYLATGDPQYETLVPNVLLRNDAGRRFQNATTSAGLGHLQKGHGVSFADIDNDGDADLYLQLGGFFPGDKFANALFMNPGTGSRFLYLKLVGTQSNRAAYGARVHVEIREGDRVRHIHRAAGSVSSFGGQPSRLEIGLGEAEEILSVEVRWPNSDRVERFEGVPLDSFIEVTEGQPSFRIQDLRPISISLP